MKTGNLKLSQICQMQIDTLGNDCFDDIETFKTNKNEPEWANFKNKIKSEQNIDMENVLLLQQRCKNIRDEINWIIFQANNAEELKSKSSNCNDQQYLSLKSKFFIEHFISNFFTHLKKNISNFIPGDLDQSKIIKLSLGQTMNRSLFCAPLGRNIYHNNVCNLNSFSLNTINYYFGKDSKGLYKVSLDKTNEDIKQAFKDFNQNNNYKKKTLTDLAGILDTDKNKSLKNTSTKWKTLKKIIKAETDVLEGLPLPVIYQYRTNLFVYMQLSNFYKILTEYISPLEISEIIETVIAFLEINIGKYNFQPIIPKNAASIMLQERFYDINDIPLEDVLYYDRNNPEDMNQVLLYSNQKRAIQTLVSETKEYCIPSYNIGATPYNRQAVLFFIDTLSSEKIIGNSSEFYFKWVKARVEYGEYKRGLTLDISTASNSYFAAYESGLYYAGPNLKEFCQEAIEVFMVAWKQDKKVNRIKEVYKFASSAGVALQLYDAFKESGFNDYAIIHPFQILLDLWDNGCDLRTITEFSGLPWQEVQRILSDNLQYLKRKDEAAIEEMQSTYISKWDCDEQGIDTLEEFND